MQPAIDVPPVEEVVTTTQNNTNTDDNTSESKSSSKTIQYTNNEKSERTADGKVKLVETKDYIPKQFIDYYSEYKDKTEEESIMLRSSKVLKNLEASLMNTRDDETYSREILESFVTELNKFHFTTIEEWRKHGLRPLCKKHKINPKKAVIRKIYMNLTHKNILEKNIDLENFLITKAMRTQSGVMVVTVFTSPFPRV